MSSNVVMDSTEKLEQTKFRDLVGRSKDIQVVRWVWSGTSSTMFDSIQNMSYTQIYVEHQQLLIMLNGSLTEVVELPFKQKFCGPQQKFKGFLFTQIRNRRVYLQYVFRNLVMYIEPLESDESPVAANPV